MNYKQGTGNIATFLSHIEVKTIAKAILFCIIVGVFFLSHDERVWAGNHVKLYVDAAASPGGDGSKHAPFARITDAVNTARVIWQADNIANIEIRVEPGTYRGRYSNTNPNLENLPIILDIPNLKLKGSTSMLVDDSGLPTGEFEPGKETLLKADPALVANQSLLIITRTDSVLTGQGVEVSKLIINVGYSTMPATVIGTGISVERVQDFTVRNNYVTGFGEAGIRTRAASGKIQGNYITELGAGTIILAGSTSSPASVLFSGNRSVNNRFGGVFLCGFAITDAGFNRLSAVVDGNDLSNSNISPVAHEGFGIRVAVVRHDPPNPGNSGNVTATISNNRISNNKIGFSIDAGFPYRIFGG